MTFCTPRRGGPLAGLRAGRGGSSRRSDRGGNPRPDPGLGGLVFSWMVGGRDYESAELFIDDLRQRLANRVQLTTDGHRPYLMAVNEGFGDDMDYAQLVKLYGELEGNAVERRYSRPRASASARTS